MKAKAPYFLMAALVLIIGSVVALGGRKPVCPDDYGTDDSGSAEYLATTDKWTNDFFDTHPDATMTNWAEARHQFYIDNRCTAALERYEEAKAGKGDPETMKLVEGVLRDALQAQ